MTSLRARLWWSYVLVSMAALAIVAVILFIYILQNPSTYRQASARLTVVAALVNRNGFFTQKTVAYDQIGAAEEAWTVGSPREAEEAATA